MYMCMKIIILSDGPSHTAGCLSVHTQRFQAAVRAASHMTVPVTTGFEGALMCFTWLRGWMGAGCLRVHTGERY